MFDPPSVSSSNCSSMGFGSLISPTTLTVNSTVSPSNTRPPPSTTRVGRSSSAGIVGPSGSVGSTGMSRPLSTIVPMPSPRILPGNAVPLAVSPSCVTTSVKPSSPSKVSSSPVCTVTVTPSTVLGGSSKLNVPSPLFVTSTGTPPIATTRGTRVSTSASSVVPCSIFSVTVVALSTGLPKLTLNVPLLPSPMVTLLTLISDTSLSTTIVVTGSPCATPS